MENNRAVLYLRLSKEDVNKLNVGDDSASIKNQRLLLTDYALERGFKVVGVYRFNRFYELVKQPLFCCLLHKCRWHNTILSMNEIRIKRMIELCRTQEVTICPNALILQAMPASL